MSAEAEPTNPDAGDNAARPRIRLHTGEVLSLIGVGILLGAAVGYLIADHTSMSIAARVLASDAIVGLPGGWFAIIITRRLARIEAGLESQLDAELRGYNRGYMDCLKERSGHRPDA